MMDISIIVTYFPTCKTWQDVARIIRANLNPRTITGTPNPGKWFEVSADHQNAVLASEIVAFFEMTGLNEEEAKRITSGMIQMGTSSL